LKTVFVKGGSGLSHEEENPAPGFRSDPPKETDDYRQDVFPDDLLDFFRIICILERNRNQSFKEGV